MKTSPSAWIGAVGLLLAGAAFFVWPTPYVIVQHQSMVMRVNRFTGVQEWSSARGWFRDTNTTGASTQRVITPSLTTEKTGASQGSLEGITVANMGDEAYEHVHLELSYLDAEGIVVGTDSQDVERIGKGDRVLVPLMPVNLARPAEQIRLDRAVASVASVTPVAMN